MIGNQVLIRVKTQQWQIYTCTKVVHVLLTGLDPAWTGAHAGLPTWRTDSSLQEQWLFYCKLKK